MINYISGLVFAILLAVGAAVVALLLPEHQMLALAVGGVWLVGAAVLSSAIRFAAEWERAVVFRLGRFREVKGPGSSVAWSPIWTPAIRRASANGSCCAPEHSHHRAP
jgi:regulator of protease activity HflC (stomatin/prohibitin superfamily)